MNLSLYISELLIKNNCVIVPNFGGFIANYQSSVIDNVRNKIYPPSKNVLFNPNLLGNDGLLANYVSVKINESYLDSLTLIDSKVVEWEQLMWRFQQQLPWAKGDDKWLLMDNVFTL